MRITDDITHLSSSLSDTRIVYIVWVLHGTLRIVVGATFVGTANPAHPAYVSCVCFEQRKICGWIDWSIDVFVASKVRKLDCAVLCIVESCHYVCVLLVAYSFETRQSANCSLPASSSVPGIVPSLMLLCSASLSQLLSRPPPFGLHVTSTSILS